MKIKELHIETKYNWDKNRDEVQGRLVFAAEESRSTIDLRFTEEETKDLLKLSLPIFERTFGEKISSIKQELEKQISND